MPISVLFSVGELNKSNEIVSMRASGIGILRLSTPIVFFALMLSVLALFLQEKVLINSQKKSQDIKLEYVKNSGDKEKIERNFVFRSKKQLFFISQFVPRDSTLKDVVILREDDQGIIAEKIVCQSIVYDGTKWNATGVISYLLDKEGKMIDTPEAFGELEIDLDEKPKEISLKQNTFSQYISLKTLKKEIKKLQGSASSAFLNNLTINYHKKIAEPLNHLFLAIGILPFALEIKKRKVGLSALGGGFIFGFLYHLIFSVSIALGKAGIILVPLSAWIAPLFFLTIGISGILLIR